MLAKQSVLNIVGIQMRNDLQHQEMCLQVVSQTNI